MKQNIFYVVLSIVLVLVFTTYGAMRRSNDMLERYKAEEIYQIKQNLKNFVDVAYSTVDSNYKNSMDKEYLEKHYGHQLKNIIDVAETIFKSKTEEVKAGRLTLAEAQLEAIKEIKNIRYNNGNSYIWISDTTLPYPKMIMHPIMPSLNGQIMDDPKYNCAMGKEQNLFVAFAELVQKQGSGFVDYLWPKVITDESIIDVPKLSYVRLFQDWNWIIGTDFYIDDAISDGMNKSKTELRQMRYDNGIGFFWINNMDESTPQFYMYPIGSIENVVLEGGRLNKLGKVIKKFIKICKRKGSGYVEFTWDKPTLKGSIKDVSKLSYVKLYEPLGWVIGTGIYMDDVDKFIAREKKYLNKQIWQLIFNISIISVVTLCIFILLYYAIGKYFSATESNKFWEEVKEKTSVSPEQPSSSEDPVKIAQELSKIMLAEQTKLLAYTATLQATKGCQEVQDSKTAVDQLTNQVRDMIVDVKKMTNKMEQDD
ncbi:cache domain-containing protein [Candidatus Halobeggiatoa sp. HSG11]|nr:cache domain-containing protein [Candidatus Halobeggiatoa sp. HSG11]